MHHVRRARNWGRLYLGIATAAVAFAVGYVLLGPPSQVCIGCDPGSVLGLPPGLVAGFVAIVMAVGGAVWIYRIYRGLRDEPPPWRYRDR